MAALEIMKYFEYDHLPQHLSQVSMSFSVLAAKMVADLPDCEQRVVALQKLLESKDAAVRAKLHKS